MDLKPAEIRVLGAMIEKSLSQPAAYPMTVNAIRVACNQKTNREPVSTYTESEVSAALASLRRRGLVAQADPERNSRAVRFKHEAEEKMGWNAAQRAIMAELMLRGPQTAGELRSRASRMTHLQSLDYTGELLNELAASTPPVAVQLQREPGRSARRFAHLLGGEVGSAAATVVRADRSAPEREPGPESALGDRVMQLEEDVANLRASLAGLRDRLRESGLLPAPDDL